jgi:hypothetical protein
MTAHDRYLVRQFNRAFGEIEWQEELTPAQADDELLRWIFKDEPVGASRDTFATLPRDFSLIASIE